MALHISHKLANLLKERAYTSGAILKSERSLLKIAKQLEILTREREGLIARISAIDTEIVDLHLMLTQVLH